MPLYEYQCRECGRRFERLQKVDDDPVAECPYCGGGVDRLLGVPALQFKGSGWYVTDYGRGNGRNGGGGESPESSGAKKETAPPSGDAGSSTSDAGD
jgi:putative FmdB family regulatory protein